MILPSTATTKAKPLKDTYISSQWLLGERWARGIGGALSYMCLTLDNVLWSQAKLEQLERLRSEDTPRRLMITHTIEPCWIPGQVKTRSNDLEDIGQGQRSSHATQLLMLVIIFTKYGKNPSRTVDATERTRFAGSRPNDLENIGQGQRSLHATHPNDDLCQIWKECKQNCRFFFKVKAEKLEKLAKNLNFRILL